MEKFYSGKSCDWSGSSSSSSTGAELANPVPGPQPPVVDRGGGPLHALLGCVSRPAGPVPSGAPKRSSDEAGFRHDCGVGAATDDHSVGLRSFKRLRIDGTGTSSLGAATSTTASSSACGSVSPPLAPPTSLARAAAAVPMPARPLPYQQRSAGDPTANFSDAPPPQPPPCPPEVSFRPLSADEWGSPNAELSRAVSSDSSAFQQQSQQHPAHHGSALSAHGDARDYAGINHVLGDLHALRRQRMEWSRRGQGQMHLSDRIDPSVGTLKGPVEASGGMGALPADKAALSGRHVDSTNGVRIMPPPFSHQHQQQQEGSNQQQELPPPPPRWRRSVRLPTSSQLY